MRTVSGALQTHLSSETSTLCTCWRVALTNGSVYGFTDTDVDIVFGGLTYRAATGYTATDVETSSQMNVDSLDVEGMLVSPSITEDDLRAGLWDFAEIRIFMVNWADLTQGALKQRFGHLGEVSLLKTGMFRAEMQGLLAAYQTTIVELTSPSCRANLGDARCKVDLVGGSPSWTVTGTIAGVSANQLTMFDPARTEAGPTGGIAVIGVSQANPGVVTLASPLGEPSGSAITIAGVGGMTSINTTTIARNPTGNTFELTVDTTAYPAYTTGGTVTPLGDNSGHFDYGLFTATSGLNIGRSMEVKSYVPGQLTLQLPMPYAMVAGDTYSMIAGCDKSFTTCRLKFNNVVNFRAEPYLPGLDKIIQIGKP